MALARMNAKAKAQQDSAAATAAPLGTLAKPAGLAATDVLGGDRKAPPCGKQKGFCPSGQGPGAVPAG